MQKKVLVTGGAGFVGSHVADRLIEEGCSVAVVDDLSTGRLENVNPAAVFYRQDITDPALSEVFAEFKPAAVIHLAAQANVITSVADPLADARVNILGTLQVLECCRRFAVTRVVYASSAAVYGPPQYLPIDEKHPVQPTSPYGITKYTPEQYFAIYRDLYGINSVILRYANVFGPRQDPLGEGGVVAIFTDQIQRGITPTVYGDGEQTRDFVYVKDVAQANWLALKFLNSLNQSGNQNVSQQHKQSLILNVSTNQRTSINELYRALYRTVTAPKKENEENALYNEHGLERECAINTVNKEHALKKENGFNNKNKCIVQDRPNYAEPRPGDIRDSCLDNRLIAECLGWKPTYSLEAGLKETAEYYSR